MREFLLGVPGKLALLLTRVPSLVASDAKIQTVDNNVDTLLTRVTTTVSSATNLQTVDNNVDTLLGRITGSIPTSIASVQTGYINASKTGNSSGEDITYKNISISSVSNVNKCFVYFQGAFTTLSYPQYAQTTLQAIVLPRLTSTSNLRLSVTINTTGNFIGRWYVVEFK